MHAELPTLSFICAALLVPFVSSRRVRTSVPHIVLIVWLFTCNIIHAINNIVWAGNVDVHTPIWCDLVTKILLGMTVALLCACICLSRSLEHATSIRNVSHDSHNMRTVKLIELALCIFLPVIYMSMHSLVQDHRFDLVENFGCSASINPTIPALILMWLPPLFLCIISFTYSGLAIYNFYRRRSKANSSSHVETPRSLTDSHFFLGLAISIITTTIIFVLVIFSIFFPNLEPWTSWSEVHQHFYDVAIVQSGRDIANIEFVWWIVPVLSLNYVLLSIVFGGEAKNLSKSFRSTSDFELPIHGTPANGNLADEISRPITTNRNEIIPTLNFQSGWDEMLSTKKSKGWGLIPKAKSPSLHSPSTSPEPSTSAHSITSRDDGVLIKSTTYLGSSPTPTLNAPAYLRPPPPVPPPSSSLQVPKRSDGPKRSNPHDNLRTSVPDDVMSTISSIWSAPWPEPPLVSSTRPRSTSSASSDTFGYPLYPTITPVNAQAGPFQDSGTTIPAVPATAKETLAKRPSKKELRKKESQEGKSDVIYMTVVKEVAPSEEY